MPHIEPLQLSGLVEFKVETALGIADIDDSAIWGPDVNEGLWDESLWNASEPYWIDITSRAIMANTSRGRDRWEQRYRTGGATNLLDNQDGVLSLSTGRLGDLQLRPGRWWRLRGRVVGVTINPERFLLAAATGIASGMEAPLPAVPVAGYKVTVTNAITAVTHTSDQPIVSAYSGASGNRLFQIEQRTDDTIRAVISHDTTATQAMTAPGTYPPGTPMDISLVVDYTVPEATLTVNGAPIVLALTATGPNTTVAPFTIGRRALSQQAGLFWRGTVEQVAMLSLADAPLVTADFSDPGLVGSLDGVDWVDGQGNAWLGLLGSAAEGTVIPNPFIDLYLGQIDSMADKYTTAAGSINSLWGLFDWFSRWSIDDPPALEIPVGGNELTSDRVTRILDIMNWPESLRDIQTGVNTMQESTLAQSRLEEMQTAADAEGGAFFVDGAGVATFKAQDWLQDDPRSNTPQMRAGAPGDHVQVLDASTDWSTSRVRNDIRMARKGGTEQRLTDGQSMSLYGPRTFQRFDLENDNDADVLELARRYLEAFRWDRARLETVGLYPLDAEGAVELMELQLGDLVRIRVSALPGWSYTGEYYVNRISHAVTKDDWNVSLRVDDADLSPPLGVTSFDEGYDEGFM